MLNVSKVNSIIEGEVDKALVRLSLYFAKYLHSPSVSRLTPNRTGKLYVKIGNLRRSLTPGMEGNKITKMFENGAYKVEFGIDATKIPYAAIHEYGGVAGRGVQLRARPYFNEAFKDFEKDPNGAQLMYNNIMELLRQEFEKGGI